MIPDAVLQIQVAEPRPVARGRELTPLQQKVSVRIRLDHHRPHSDPVEERAAGRERSSGRGTPRDRRALRRGDPAVLECAVVGQEDADSLLKPHAFVALRPEVRAEGLEEALQALAREKLEPYKCPRWVTFVPELPKTATGKIQRYLLRQKRTTSRGGNGISHEVGYS